MIIRICKNCGNIYSRKAGMKVVNNCPSCGSPNKRQVELEEG